MFNRYVKNNLAYFVLCSIVLFLVAGSVANSQAKEGAKHQNIKVFRDVFVDGSHRNGPELVLLDSASFIMGRMPGDDGYKIVETPHAVTLSGFAMGRYEITNQQFAAFLNEQSPTPGTMARWLNIGSSPGLFYSQKDGVVKVVAEYKQIPVTGVSWQGAIAFGRWLSAKTGEVYTLPTEAQWEYAAQSGVKTLYPWGDGFNPEKINCNKAIKKRGAKPVGSFVANGYGIYDMLGNVWEWTLDCKKIGSYYFSPSRDPQFLDSQCLVPIIRGGSFNDPPSMCRAKNRANFWWRGHPDRIGFRVVRRNRSKK
ncbi:MAG: formylglycine-generating enzyme family protein [Magnetococcales bacterium]|nr:formylglycine-generating enzyme family protein [Magnetococcales bacterium]